MFPCMGVREAKAARTRDALHRAVLTLAEERGYEAVTIEMIAERAEVGVSTLYRHFPHKDAILLEPAARDVGALADALRARPADEPCDVALGRALQAYFTRAPEAHERIARLRRQLDVAPGPRGRLWDLRHQQLTLLAEAVAEREDAAPTELRVAVLAQSTMMIVQLAFDRLHDGRADAAPGDVVGEVIAAFRSGVLRVPTLHAR
jgi:AcrR family transcriptional regulator